MTCWKSTIIFTGIFIEITWNCAFICVYLMTSPNMQLKLCVIYLDHPQIHDFSTEVIMHSCDIIKTVLQRCVFFTYVAYVCLIRVNERVYVFWTLRTYTYVKKTHHWKTALSRIHLKCIFFMYLLYKTNRFHFSVVSSIRCTEGR